MVAVDTAGARGSIVNVISVSSFHGGMQVPAYTASEHGLLARMPAGRWGTPADVAGAVVFLACDASAYVSGTFVAVDGGYLAR